MRPSTNIGGQSLPFGETLKSIRPRMYGSESLITLSGRLIGTPRIWVPMIELIDHSHRLILKVITLISLRRVYRFKGPLWGRYNRTTDLL